VCGIGAESDADEIEEARANRSNQPDEEQDFSDQLDQIQSGGVVLDVALLQRHWATDVALDQADTQKSDKQKLVANEPEGKFEAQQFGPRGQQVTHAQNQQDRESE